MKYILTITILFFQYFLISQKTNFLLNGDLFGRRVFIKNNGQFNNDIPNKNTSVSYAYIKGDEQVYFTPMGLVYHIQKKHPLTHEQMEEIEHNSPKKDELKETEHYYVNMFWENANPNMSIEVSEKQNSYHSFGNEEFKSDCYKKLLYKNVYDNIDIEYFFPKDKLEGIKYNVILHPGANPNDIKVKYTGDVKSIKLNNGNAIIKTSTSEIVEHAPISTQNNLIVETKFSLNQNCIQFMFSKNYDVSQELIIDPFVTTITSLTSNNYAFDVDYDVAGNTYIYGGSGPYLIAKYDPSGTLLWTFFGVLSSPSWNSSGSFGNAGNFVVDKVSGKCYMGQGFVNGSPGAKVIRINASGFYDSFISGSNNKFNEIWDMGFYCQTNSLYVLGGSAESGATNSAMVINQTSGAITLRNFTGNTSNNSQDVVSNAIDPLGNVFIAMAGGSALTNNKLLAINSTFNGNLWLQPSTYNNLFEGANKNYPGGSPASNGFNALAVNNNYLYFYDGYNIAAYNKATGAKLGSTIVSGHAPISQGGIAVDNCDNIYVGGQSSVLSYNFNGSTFSVLTPITVPNTVTDIKYDENTNLLHVCGNSFVGTYSAINSTVCASIAQLSIIPNCSGTNAVGALSTTILNPTISYEWANSSGVIVSQTTNTTALTNSVTLAAGFYTLTAKINEPCGPVRTQTVEMGISSFPTVTPLISSTLTCSNTLVNASVTTTSTPVTYLWSGSGITSSTTNSLITVNQGGIFEYTVTSSANCSTSGTLTVTQNTVIPSFSLTTAPSVTTNCSNPSATLSAISNTDPNSIYTWLTPISTTLTGSPVTTNAPGIYTVYVTNTINGCSTASFPSTVEVVSDAGIATVTLSANTLSITCLNPTPSLTVSVNVSTVIYSWTPTSGILSGSNSSMPVFNATGSYSLVVTNTINNCSTNSNVVTVVSNTTAPSFSVVPISTNTIIGCGANSAVTFSVNVISPSGLVTYNWIPSGVTTSTNVANAAGVYSVIVTDAVSGCSTSVEYVVNSNTIVPNLASNPNELFPCASTTTSIMATSTSTNISYLWGGPSGAILSSLSNSVIIIGAPGVYTVTVTDITTLCTNSNTIFVTQNNITANFSANPNIGIAPLLVNFTNQTIGATSYFWTFGDGNTSLNINPTNTYTNIGTYTVTLLTSSGTCTSSISLIIIVEEDFTIQIPNVFTPNGDGANDIFIIRATGLKELDLQIFNRWGQKIYEFSGINAYWDGYTGTGGKAPDGTYFYLIKALGTGNKKVEKNGFFNLFR